jgi:hypothetical protein
VYSSKIDVDEQRLVNVRFTSESGHSLTRSGCLLWADFVVEVIFEGVWAGLMIF